MNRIRYQYLIPINVMYWTTWLGSSANSYLANRSGFNFTYLKGTNCTISLNNLFPLLLNKPPSPSNFFMLVKSAFPTPTIMIDKGRSIALKIKSIVFYMS